MNIHNITILRCSGPDIIMLDTDLPPSLTASVESPTVKFECTAGKGEAYCKVNFPGVPIIVVYQGGKKP